MFQFKINGERLKKLMNDNNIKAYKLSKELERKGYSISTNTIANYMKEKTPPKNLEYVKAIADYFNVSTDFLLGIAPTPTNNIDLKDICNKYGLNEKSLSVLEFHNRRNIDFNCQEINTINYLLEDLLVNKQNSIIEAITQYCYFDNINESRVNVQIRINGTNENLEISKDFLLEQVLIKEIEYKLNYLKNEIRKEGENDECKRTRKK